MECPDDPLYRPFVTPLMGGRFGITLPCPPRSVALPRRYLTFSQALGLLLYSACDAGGHGFDYRAIVALRHHPN